MYEECNTGLGGCKKLVYKYDSTNVSRLRIEDRFNGPTDGRFFYYRGFRMNYYAVSGILARAYLYNNQPNEAYKIAKKLLISRTIRNIKFYFGK